MTRALLPLLFLLCQTALAQEPPQRTILEADSVDEPLPAACIELAKKGAREEASRCLAEAFEGDPALAAEASALAGKLPEAEERPDVVDAALAFPSRLGEGGPELLVSGTAYGGLAGFLVAGSAFSGLRTRQADSLPWLVASPAIGALAGLAVSTTAALALRPEGGDVSLISSGLWGGTALGLSLQLVFFDGNDDVKHVPMRFLTVLASGLALSGAAAAAAPWLAIDGGHVGLAHSAALWSGVLAAFTLSAGQGFGLRGGLGGAPAITAITAVSAAGYLGALALHPFYEIERASTWLVEVGGVAGLLGGLALLSVLNASGFTGPAELIVFGTLTATTATGVVTGGLLAFQLDRFFKDLPSLGQLGDELSLAPVLLPHPALPEAPAFGLVLTLQGGAR